MMIRGLEKLSLLRQGERVGIVQTGDEKAPETLEHPSVPKGLQESRKGTTCSDRTRGNGFKRKEGGFILGIKKKFFTVRVKGDWRHWNWSEWLWMPHP